MKALHPSPLDQRINPEDAQIHFSTAELNLNVASRHSPKQNFDHMCLK
jgi:hypothetical protein